MKAFLSTCNDAGLNLGFEEHQFLSARDEVFIVYFNSPSVIIGRNQNPFAEANIPFIIKNNIPLYRRISGGGTVYHDPGNLNFSILTNNSISDYSFPLTLICGFLKTLGIEAYPGKSNSVFTSGYKVSGNAQHLSRNRRLTHGTLLLNVNLQVMQQALSPVQMAFHRSVMSVRSQTANICNLLHDTLTYHDIASQFLKYVQQNYDIEEPVPVNPSVCPEAVHLAETKYKTWDWNYGKTSPFRMVLNTKDNKQIEALIEGAKIINIDGEPGSGFIKITGMRLDDVLNKLAEL